jgi:peptidylprolyl isomerase
MARRIAWLLTAAAALVLPACDGSAKEMKLEYEPGRTAIVRYEDLVEGTGPEAKIGDQVSFAYTGTLLDGKKLDSKTAEDPATFELGRSTGIKGLDAIVGMKVGGKRKLTIPPRLGYGSRGSTSIPPDATLVYEVELLKIGTNEESKVPDDGGKTAKEVDVEYGFGKKAKLKYIDLKEGDGAEAKTGDNVSVHYTGWLSTGKKFDSSKDRGKSFGVPLGEGRVIKGWDAGLPGMKVGGKRKLIIPSELGYGAAGHGEDIPPNATLIFEVELLRVN